MPLLTALAAQLAAGAVVFGAAFALTAGVELRPPLMALLALQGIGAAVLGTRFGLAQWWISIQLVLPSALAVAWLWQVPGWIFLVLFGLLVLVFWNSALGGVPLYLSNPQARAALAALLPQEAGSGETATGTKQEAPGEAVRPGVSPEKNIREAVRPGVSPENNIREAVRPGVSPENNIREAVRPGVRFADLGCGLGGPVLDLARRRPDGNFTGIESAPLPFALAWLRLRFAGLANVKVLFGDYRSHGLGEYDVVYAFLSPVPMPDLFDKAKHEMKSGSLLISNTFDVPGHPADETVEVADRRRTSLYLWRL
ncbi:MAG: hypothetical protein IH994_10635 [Proteobacteria bacterium]|nr:hypothetical protein [Pseudomonadota bacterium]